MVDRHGAPSATIADSLELTCGSAPTFVERLGYALRQRLPVQPSSRSPRAELAGAFLYIRPSKPHSLTVPQDMRLILHRAKNHRPGGHWSEHDYDVTCDGETVGRIYLANPHSQTGYVTA